MIIEQTASAQWIGHSSGDGTSSDGLGDSQVVTTNGSFYYGTSSGTHYTVLPGSNTLTVNCSPSVSSTGACGAYWTVTAYPITLSISGVKSYNGGMVALCGQQITASLTGYPSGCTLLDGQWAILSDTVDAGTGVFSNYANGQLTSLPGIDHVVTYSFYASTPQTLQLEAGLPTFSVPVVSNGTTTYTTIQSGSILSNLISFYNPTVTGWNATATADGANAGLGASVSWSAPTISVPAPFSGGSLGVTQTADSISRTESGYLNYSTSNAHDATVTNNGGGAASDSMSQAIPVGGEATAADTYETWLMYLPPGTNSVSIPLLYSGTWGWDGQGNEYTTGALDSVCAFSPAAPVGGVIWDPADDRWPTWLSVYSGVKMTSSP